MLSHDQYNRDLEKMVNDALRKEFGSSEFLVGDLDAQALRNSLTNNKQNVLVLEKLGTTTDKLNQVTEQDFVRAFNEILSMHDFHIRVDANAYKSIISKEMQGVLVRAQTPDAKLSDLEYLRLNKALLQAIYPHETRKTLSKEMQWVLVRAQTPDAKLSDLEYLRLNRALLQAIYPHE